MLFGFFKKQDINKGVLEFNNTPDAILLDVRTKSEYKNGHIPRSKNIELEKLDTVNSLANEKNRPIFVYCQSGARSSSATSTLKTMGYTNVKNIGGISSYTGAVESGV